MRGRWVDDALGIQQANGIRVVSEGTELLDQRCRDALELRVNVPQSHLFQVILRRMRSLPIRPGDEREERPPRVPYERHAALTEAFHGSDGIHQPCAPPGDGTHRGGFRDEDWCLITLPVKPAELIDDVRI